MRDKRGLCSALACLLALTLAACGGEGAPEGSQPSQGSGSISSAAPTQSGGQSEPKRDEPKESKKDEPALDWSAVEAASEEDFKYTYTSVGPKDNEVKGLEITKYLGEGGVVKIPDSIEGLPVLLIEKGAFKGSRVTDVCFETEGSVFIKNEAFQSCDVLKSVVIRGNEESQIRNLAFDGCTSLTSVVLSEEITDFGYCVFQGTPWLENKKQENPMVIVNDTVLDGLKCSGDVTVPDGVIRIAPSAFESNRDITSVKLPDSIRRIDELAFSNCASLTEINISDDMESIGDKLGFSGCKDVVVTYKGKKYTYDKLEELETLLGSAE